MTIYYSATTNAFYDSQVYNVNNIPEDKVAVAESTYKNLMAQQCAGRVIVAAADGTPTTIAQTCGPCTSTKYATKTELTNGLAAKANDSNVVHKTGDEHINGVKSFGSVIKATNGTVQVGADTGYSVTFNHNGNITSKQARGTYNIFLPNANGTLALDENAVHKTGDESLDGTKIFLNDIFRKNTSVDLTVTPPEYTNANTNIMFVDKNDKTLGFIEYVQRPSGVNDIGMFANDKNGNSHGIHINTNNEVIPLLRSSEPYSLGSATHKWANVYATTFNGDLKGNADNGVDSYGGSWIRFKNGIQMCWGVGAFDERISYPVAFNSEPRIICTPALDVPQSLVVNFYLKTNTLFSCRLWNVHTGSWQADSHFDWIAIGTW